MHALLDFVVSLGIVAILFVIFAESGLLIGFFLPGDSLLFTAGFLVQQGILDISVHVFVALLFIAAALGDSTGYSFGRRVGRKLFERQNSRLFHQENLRRAEAFYKKHGAKTIILARFVPIVRTFAPIIAGVSHMQYRTFLIFNLVGAALWTATFTYLGYYAGQKLTDMGVNIELAAIVIVFVSIVPMLIHTLKDKHRRVQLLEGTKQQLRVLLQRRRSPK